MPNHLRGSTGLQLMPFDCGGAEANEPAARFRPRPIVHPRNDGGTKQNGVHLELRAPSRPVKEMSPHVVSAGAAVLLLALSSDPASGNFTTPASNSSTTTASPGPNIAAIVAPTVTLGVLAIVAVVVWLLCVVKKKRQTEGTYRPSAEEQSGTHSVAALDAMKLPKEERLI